MPYTYTITHKPTGVRYYGARYAKDCTPSDLGVTYFSSSKRLRQRILQEGVHMFEFKVRRVFDSKHQCIMWESKVLKRVQAAQSDKWFNLHNGDGKLLNGGGYKLSTLTRQRMSKPKSPEHKAKLAEHLSIVRIIPPQTPEAIAAKSHRMRGNTIAKGHSRVVSEQEKRLKSERMKGNQQGKLPKNHSPRQCPYCGKIGKGGNMTRYHFDNCNGKERERAP